MSEDDPENLLARISIGDRAAFRRLYEVLGAKLFGVSLRILAHRSDAEDAVQETFVKIWHNADRFSAERGQAEAWLVSIARNQAIDSLRARKPGGRDLSSMPELRDLAPSPEEAALAADDRRRIALCLETLPADRASAVCAAYLEGFSYLELARRFGVPLNTMRTWLRRALISLRECLEP